MAELLVVSGRFPGLQPHAGGPVPLEVALHATVGDDTPLWSDRLPAVPVGPDGSVHVVLGAGTPLPAGLFIRYPRFLAVGLPGAGAAGPRVPVTGAAIRHGARLAALEAASPAVADPDTARMLARLPSRLRTLGEGYADVHARLVAVEDNHGEEREQSATCWPAAAEGRLRRVEDQVEDLVGPPHGEVVALAGRIAVLEAQVAALTAALARLAEALPGGGAGPREGG